MTIDGKKLVCRKVRNMSFGRALSSTLHLFCSPAKDRLSGIIIEMTHTARTHM